jgi:hypothetical protein
MADILSYTLADGIWDDSLIKDEINIAGMAAGTMLINFSLFHMVKKWNPLLVAHGYTFVSVEEGWQVSNVQDKYRVMKHMAMKRNDHSFKKEGPSRVMHVIHLYNSALAAKKSNVLRTQSILDKQLATYGERFFDFAMFPYSDSSAQLKRRGTPTLQDNTKRCDFCSAIGHIEMECYHRDPTQMLLCPPVDGYIDGKIPESKLVKFQCPHNMFQARIATSHELSGELHGFRKYSKTDKYDWDNDLPSATEVFLRTLPMTHPIPPPTRQVCKIDDYDNDSDDDNYDWRAAKPTTGVDNSQATVLHQAPAMSEDEESTQSWMSEGSSILIGDYLSSPKYTTFLCSPPYDSLSPILSPPPEELSALLESHIPDL